MKEEILLNLIGTTDWLSFMFLVFYVGLGSFTLRIIWAMTRQPEKGASPVHFSWRYFLNDNLLKFIGEWFLGIIIIRFSENYLGEKGTNFVAFGIGLVSNILPMYLGRWIKSLQDKMGGA